MSVRCLNCDAATVWDDSVGSTICTSCGSLADPSQTVLTSSQYGNHNDTSDPSLWDSSASTTLKSLRSGNNWDLAGQSKESRDRRNSYAMADFIKSLAVSFNASGLSPRAITLFTQAKSASNFRWGQKSRSVAAACVAIALRESNRPDSIRDIASLLRVPITSVSREFMSITSTLKLSLNLVDPSVHISALHNHVASVLKGNQQGHRLSDSFLNSLPETCWRSVAKTATSLSQVLARLSPNHDVLRLPVPPTACGLFILALEAENRTVLSSLGEFAQFLGARCHASKSVVMSRYKTVQDEIEIWVQKVPWLAQYEVKNGRAKVSKRLIVARGLKDVIKFHEDIWEQQTKSLVEADLGSEDDPVPDLVHCPRKRPKLNHALSQTTQFLLNPLGQSVFHTLSAAAKSSETMPSPNTSQLPLATYILTNPSNPFLGRPPTRLQLLAQERGGVGDAEILDDELFAEGEFEKLLRSEDETRILRHTFDWIEAEEREENAQSSSTHRPTRNRSKRSKTDGADAEELLPRKKSRINMEALAQFLTGGGEADATRHPEDIDNDTALLGLEEAVNNFDIDAYDFQGDGDMVEPPSILRKTQRKANLYDNTGDEEIVLEEWRPPSPSGAMGMQYEEEYD